MKHALDPDANAAPKGLRQCLGLAQLVGVDLAASQHGKGDILVHGTREGLVEGWLARYECHVPRMSPPAPAARSPCVANLSDGRLASAGFASKEDRPPSNLALFDHLRGAVG